MFLGTTTSATVNGRTSLSLLLLNKNFIFIKYILILIILSFIHQFQYHFVFNINLYGKLYPKQQILGIRYIFGKLVGAASKLSLKSN